LDGADCRGATLNGARLQRASLSRANLFQADLQRANLRKASLDGAMLRGADLRGADLGYASLAGAVLVAADLREAQLVFADLRHAFLIHADLGRAFLKGASLTFADLRRARMDRAYLADAVCLHTSFVDVDLSTIDGLDRLRHLGPSSVDLDTLQRSAGSVPESFLRGCGVSRSIAAILPTLRRERATWFDAFVVTTTEDDAFGRQLRRELDAAGVRAWLRPLDDRGDGTQEDPVRGVDVRDSRILLVCSRHALEDERVLQQIEWARGREGTPVDIVVPIVTDGVVRGRTDAIGDWLCDRAAVNFTAWRRIERFHASLEALLAVLRRAPPS
jgi:uncharacterized protein YjbI with pentapeptide repeats